MQNVSSPNVRNGRLPLQTFFVFGVILLATVGATWWVAKTHFDKSEISDTVFDNLDSTIHEMNHVLLTDNKMKDNEMATRLSYPEFSEKVRLWKPRLDSVVWLGVAFHNYMLLCRNSLLYDLNYQGASKAMFDGIYDSALSLQRRLFSILAQGNQYYLRDSLIEKEVKQIISTDYYNSLSLSGKLAVLTQIEHSTFKTTNSVAEALSQQIAYHPMIYDAFDVLIGQNATYLLPGQTLEISAGLGTYSRTVKPVVSINGENQSINDFGMSMYKKLISPTDTGGSISVSVSFRDPNSGETKSKSTQLSYTVFQKPKK